MHTHCLSYCLVLSILLAGCGALRPPGASEADFRRAAENGQRAREALLRSHRYMEAWLAQADSATGLIPRNLERDRQIWNAQDAAADNYPFLVLTAALTDRPLFEGRMRRMLETERSLTSRLGPLPDTYHFAARAFQAPEADLDALLFGASEYIKDGLLPLTEWLGPSPWSARMLEMLDEMWRRAPVETPYGPIVSTNPEVNGEMLQVLARIYWMTGDRKYLDWAVRLGDYYLLGGHHPTRDATRLRLRDHGCEIVSGLCELYAAVHFALPEKKAAYREGIHAMLDRILEVGRNPHGLFYNVIDPQTGEPVDSRTSDTWGYTLNGFYTVYLLDGVEAYREAVRTALGALDTHYRSYAWEGESADGYADAIEGALNLYNRERVRAAADWMDREIQVMWSKQRPDGIVEGWHGDGNFARTSIMYSLWKTQGAVADPWRRDIVLGAVQEGGMLLLSVASETPWQGRLMFDVPRHRKDMGLPLDWPRINQFPEWFTVEAGKRYRLTDYATGSEETYTGEQLSEGLPVRLQAGVAKRLLLKEE